NATSWYSRTSPRIWVRICAARSLSGLIVRDPRESRGMAAGHGVDVGLRLARPYQGDRTRLASSDVRTHGCRLDFRRHDANLCAGELARGDGRRIPWPRWVEHAIEDVWGPRLDLLVHMGEVGPDHAE